MSDYLYFVKHENSGLKVYLERGSWKVQGNSSNFIRKKTNLTWRVNADGLGCCDSLVASTHCYLARENMSRVATPSCLEFS